jgi:hypothetical protein
MVLLVHYTSQPPAAENTGVTLDTFKTQFIERHASVSGKKT